MVNTVASDAMRIGGCFDVSARFAGAIVSWMVCSAIPLSSSTELGIVVLIGVPVLTVLTFPMMRPLHSTQAIQREVVGKLTALGADTVSGLRILRGIGGEEVFLARYKDRSEVVRLAGNRVASPQALLESGQSCCPQLLVAAVTILTARLVVGGTLSATDLISFFGFTAFLTMPLRTVIEGIIAATRGVVGARKVLAVMAVSPATVEATDLVASPAVGATLADPHSGFEAAAGRLTALVTETPEEAQVIADRLGRFTAPGGADSSEATLGGALLRDLLLEEVRTPDRRERGRAAALQRPLRDELTPHSTPSDAEILDVIAQPSAEDVLEALADGLDTHVEERGRSFSGGQRQRLALVRVLLLDPEFLVLVEPTSAVDTHTEGRIAARLREARGDQRHRRRDDEPAALGARRRGLLRRRRRRGSARTPRRPPGRASPRIGRSSCGGTTREPPSHRHVDARSAATRAPSAATTARLGDPRADVFGLAAVVGLVGPWVLGELVEDITNHTLTVGVAPTARR